MTLMRLAASLFAAALCLLAQDAQPPADGGAAPASKRFRVDTGARIPLNLINSISTKSAEPGDRVYLETAFPIVIDGTIVIPPGSYVAGTVTSVKRAGKVKGRAELFVRFDSLTLPNGVTRDLRGTVNKLDGTSSEQVDKDEGVIKGDGGKGDDAVRVGEAAGWGTTIGAVAGRSVKGAGIGAAAGATAGLVGVLMSRGPDAVLERGTTIEMVLDRPIDFAESEVQFGNYQSRPLTSGPGEQQRRRGWLGRN
jgi:hypothetical protein